MKLIKLLDNIEENRKKTNQRYPVREIAFLVLVALICGYSTWTSITEFGEHNLKWLRKHMPYKNGIPTRHNVARIIKMIKPESLNELLISWAKVYSKKAKNISENDPKDVENETINSFFAIDGKEVRGMKACTGEVLNVVTAFEVENGISFSTETGTGKGQEIQMVQSVLKTLNLNKCIVTLDALHCQKETITQIVKGKGDALIQVKGNQPNLYKAIDEQFQVLWSEKDCDKKSVIKKEKEHGRQETRQVFMLDTNFDKELERTWPHIKKIIAVTRERKTLKKAGTHETSYYLCTTDKLTLEDVMKYTRGHWMVENALHWRLDVVMKEDDSELHDRKSAINLAMLRRFALNLLRVTEYVIGKKEASVPSKMRKCVHDLNFRNKVIFKMRLI